MSLVAYGSSDESSEEEEASESIVRNVASLTDKTRTVLSLPAPKEPVFPTSNFHFKGEDDEINTSKSLVSDTGEAALFKSLPKPKHIEIDPVDEKEDDIIPVQKESRTSQDKVSKKNRATVKISLPSLSEFRDVEEEQEERRKNRIKPSEKGTGLFSILPPPKGSSTKATIKNLIPDAVKKVLHPLRPIQPKQVKISANTMITTKKANPLASLNYESDSDEESNAVGDAKTKVEGKIDFFSLDKSNEISPSLESSSKDFFSLSEEPRITPSKSGGATDILGTYTDQNRGNGSQAFQITEQEVESRSEETGFVSSTMEYEDGGRGLENSEKTLTSNVINLPKEEILLKNKAEVGPKLPVPEQEYNVDSQGNVAFDEKAMEYLCGRRGAKRKNKDFDEANIIEINGEDIKPDEREWLVKALTEEAAERPVSMESAGPSTQSRKKHQITYLAHQAKAMEVELKNQWAQNRVTRKQTQSKYGF